MDEQWGPWIDHDGKGCPCRGQWVQVECRDGWTHEGLAEMSTVSRDGNKPRPYNPKCPSRWVWVEVLRKNQIIRYRIRKPKGLTILEGLLEDLDVQMDEHQGA